MTVKKVEYIIEDLEDIISALISHADLYSQSLQNGNEWHQRNAIYSFNQAHECLVDEFGIQTYAEAMALLDHLKNNGNYQARSICGALPEGKPIDHHESILAFNRP